MTTTELICFLNSIKTEVQHKNLLNAEYELEKLIHNLEVEGLEEVEEFTW
jgi:hypothetical protein